MPVAVAWFAVVLMITAVGAAAGEPACETRVLEIDTLAEVLEAIDGYDTQATTNQSRFVADFLLGLAARSDLQARPGGFEVRPERFVQAWLAATGQLRDDLPETMARVLEYQQRFVVRPATAIRIDAEGRAPLRTLAVRVSWPAGDPAPSHYSYIDTLSDPEVLLRHERVITYLLADFGDWVGFEQIEGVSAQPTSGPRGSLAQVLGMAEIRSTRFAVADDGLQVLRTEAHKLFRFIHLSTVAPDGASERGIPRGRNDLEKLADRLDVDLETAGVERRDRCR